MNVLNPYTKFKSKLVEIVVKMSDLINNQNLQERLKNIEESIKEDLFSIVVIGQFKRGKTTLINALIGKNLLPTAIIPLTSIITILNYGEKLSIKVFFKDEAARNISLKELPEFITEKYNPNNKKKVDKVEIQYPSAYLKNGVRIIDTPGVASVHEHNTRATYEYMPNADAAIFLVSPDPPLTHAELNFLKEVKKHFSKMFFVQNKIDLVSEEEKNESLIFTKDIIEKQAGFKNISIYPFSAKTALEGKLQKDPQKIAKSGLRTFEKTLTNFLIEEKGKTMIRSLASKSLSVLNEAVFLNEIELKSLSLPLRELEEKIRSFERYLESIKQERTDSTVLFREELDSLIKNVLEEDLETLKKEKTKALLKEIDKLYQKNSKRNNKELIKIFNEFLENQIVNIFNDWQIAEEKKLNRQIKTSLSRFTEKINSIIKNIIDLAVNLFGLSATSISFKGVLPKETEFSFKIQEDEELLSATIDFITKSLPSILAHKLILKDVLGRAESLIDRHCGRLRYDFVQRINKIYGEYQDSTEKTVRVITDDIMRILSFSKKTKRDSVRETLRQEKELIKKLLELKKMKKTFNKFINK